MECCDLAVTLSLAVLLDLLAGDREDWPHPVRLMGKAVDTVCGSVSSLPVSPFLQGAVASLSLVTATWLAVYCLTEAAHLVSDWLGVAVSAIIIYYGISIRCLAQEAEAVVDALEQQGIEAARKRLSRIVGRDTSSLSSSSVCMAAVETVAENLVDGIISPLFYAAVAGPAGCMAFKMINTLDSMIGYRDSRYILFGRFAARMDDAANYIPARLSVPVISAACALLSITSPGRKTSPAAVFRGTVEDGQKHSSPNSGLPESAFAWCLDIRLGGPAIYNGHEVEYPYINEKGRAPGPDDVRRAITMLYAGSLTFAIAAVITVTFF